MEASSATDKPKVERPSYLKVQMPEPSPHMPGTAPLGVHSVEEHPPAPAKDPSDAIIEIANTLLRAATARIAYHEAHAKRLRDACASFAAMSRQPATTDAAPGGQDVLAELLRVAKTIQPENGGT